MNFMGIDIGTSGCKTAVFDENGQQLALVNKEYDVIFTDDGGVELDSDEVIEKCFESIRKCHAFIKNSCENAWIQRNRATGSSLSAFSAACFCFSPTGYEN